MSVHWPLQIYAWVVSLSIWILKNIYTILCLKASLSIEMLVLVKIVSIDFF